MNLVSVDFCLVLYLDGTIIWYLEREKKKKSTWGLFSNVRLDRRVELKNLDWCMGEIKLSL